MFQNTPLTVQQAPESEDVYWENCEIQYNIGRVIGLWVAVIILIFISLGALVGMDYGQNYLLVNYPELSQNIF